MFDIGFWELVIIAVVALVIVGPEEFPSLVRNVTRGLSAVRRFVGAVKSDLDYEISKAEEIKKLIAEEAKVAQMQELLDEANDQLTVPVNNDKQARPVQQDERLENRSAETPQKSQLPGASSEQKQTQN